MKDLMIKKGKQAVHKEVQEILPWFVNNTLSDRERIKVMTHLSDCAACRAERDALLLLQAQVAREGEETDADYRPAFDKLMAQIDAREQTLLKDPETLPLPSARPQWLAFAAAACLALGVYMVIALPSAEVSDPALNPEFKTLSLRSPPPEGAVETLALTFEQPIQAATLRSVFIETGSYIVSGPDAEGRYIVEIPIPQGSTKDAFLHSIQQIDGVKYAAYQP